MSLRTGDRRPAPKEEITMSTDTAYTLDQFLADTRMTIKPNGIPSGLAEIRDHLEKLLRNPELLKKHLTAPAGSSTGTTGTPPACGAGDSSTTAAARATRSWRCSASS
jgi:hypothetical protein